MFLIPNNNEVSIHLKNLELKSYSILRDQLAKRNLIIAEKELLQREIDILDMKEIAQYRLDIAKQKKMIYHIYSECSSKVLTDIIQSNSVLTDILNEYFLSDRYMLASQTFWINQGGMTISPHQDRSYDRDKQLNIIIPLSIHMNKKYAMSYSAVSKGTELDHKFNISKMVFYAKSIQDYKFEVQYKPGDIVLHTEFSLHKSRNMPKTEHRIMYARYVAKLIKNHQTKVRINNKIN